MIAALTFFFKTGHFPRAYRKLFRDISNCCLTPGAPGQAKVAGETVKCMTTGKRLNLGIYATDTYLIDRDTLEVMTYRDQNDKPISHPSLKTLRKVLHHMIRKGQPFQMTGIGKSGTSFSPGNH